MGKFYNAIMGLVVGDALGVPFEFRSRDSFKAVGMTGFGTHNQPPGTWSDDSSMTIATVESMARTGNIDLCDIMSNFARWYIGGDFTAHGQIFDIGMTTRKAIIRFDSGVDVYECGGTSPMDNGNGALMRILPMAFYPKGVFGDVNDVCGLTHNHSISKIACCFYVHTAKMIKNGISPKLAIVQNVDYFDYFSGLPEEFSRMKSLDKLSRDEIKSTGFVVHTLEAALWCLLKADSYRDTVLMAVNLGGDTDTTAAVAGGLAGILYGIGGEKGIPEEWIDQIAKHDQIKNLCTKFEEQFNGSGVK